LPASPRFARGRSSAKSETALASEPNPLFRSSERWRHSRRSLTDGRCLRLLARFHRANVETATTRVDFDVATRMNSKGGTDKPTPELNQTLPFRERLGCSPSEACVALGVGRTFLYQLIAEGRVEVTKLGRRTIVSVSSLLKLLGGPS
jgi:excisionase family DNA binding protein